MTTEIALTLAILTGTIALLVFDRLPPAIVSLMALLALVFTGLLTPAEALSSLSSRSFRPAWPPGWGAWCFAWRGTGNGC
jgi:Na+/H+ antiporter NhaD/arsenite permease-like protein